MVFLHGRLWVACTTGEELVGVDPTTLRAGSRVHLPGDPDALSAWGDRLVVALQDGPALAVVDPGPSEGSPHVVRRQALGHQGKLYDRANVDVVVRSGTAVVSSYLGGGVYRVPLR
jgi:hypothetical protein